VSNILQVSPVRQQQHIVRDEDYAMEEEEDASIYRTWNRAQGVPPPPPPRRDVPETWRLPPTRAATAAEVPRGSHAASVDRLVQYPDVRRKIEKHPASHRFHQLRALGYSDGLDDGFLAMFEEELLAVDAREDADLYAFMNHLRSRHSKSESGGGAMEKVVAAAKAVDLALAGGGGSSGSRLSNEDLEVRWRELLEASNAVFPSELPIGVLLARRGGDAPAPGAGLPRHRAVLFKYICDSLQLCSSALLWDAKHGTAISLVWAEGPEGGPWVVDLKANPGRLTSGEDLHRVVLMVSQAEGATRLRAHHTALRAAMTRYRLATAA